MNSLYSSEILRYLGSCKPYPESDAPSAHAKRVRAVEQWSGRAALTVLGVLGALAIAHWLEPLPPWLLSVARLLGLLGLLTWAVNLLALPVMGLARFKSWNADITDYDVRSETYIQRLAEPLLRCAPEQLKYVDARLSERFDGINGRISIVFGEGVLKAGVLALIFAALDTLGKLPEQVQKLGLSLSPTLLISIAIYLVLFSIVTPISVKMFASRYPFQRRIIKVTLDLQELQRSEARATFKVPGLDQCLEQSRELMVGGSAVDRQVAAMKTVDVDTSLVPS